MTDGDGQHANTGAVRLWHKHGLEIVGTLPETLRHPAKGFGDAWVMYKLLNA